MPGTENFSDTWISITINKTDRSKCRFVDQIADFIQCHNCRSSSVKFLLHPFRLILYKIVLYSINSVKD